MTPRDRVTQALAHRPTDFCPYEVGFWGELRDRLVAHSEDPDFDRGLVPHLGGINIGYPETAERLDESHYTDAFGVVWEESFPGEIGMVRTPVLREPTLQGYEFPSPYAPGIFDLFDEQAAAQPDRYLLWGIGFSLYERAWSLRGMETFLLDMIERPAFAHELLDRICEFNVALTERACQHAFDMVRFGDDWGSQRGLIMGPFLWREFIKPRFARMVEAAAAHGRTTLLHSDGDVSAIIPDLIEVGLTCLNPVQPDVMDIYELKREYGKDLAFHGGVSVQHLLPDETPEGVRAEVRRLLREVGAGGGFIIAPTHSLGRDIPLENLLALTDELTHET
jgi:uroporphyrinogen decarboxylase